MSIGTSEYFEKPHSSEQLTAANVLLHDHVNPLLHEAEQAGAYSPVEDPDTGSLISGARGGDGDGGFRTPASQTGAPNSSHREAKGVDVHDPADRLDSWLSSFEQGEGNNSMLEKHGLYREAPAATPGWCHLTTRAPASGKRTFLP